MNVSEPVAASNPFPIRSIDLIYVMTLLASGMAVFGTPSIVFSLIVIAVWIAARPMKWPPGTILTFLFLAGLLGAWFAWTSFEVYRRSLRDYCPFNLRQLGLAVLNYENWHGERLPDIVFDENGEPMHSWRTLLLPYIEHSSLFERYRFDQPWDSPENMNLVSQIGDCFTCRKSNLPAGFTTYKIIANESTGRTIYESGTNFEPCLTLIEGINNPVRWTEPESVTVDESIAILKASADKQPHQKWTSHGRQSYSYAAFSDGRVTRINPECSEELLRQAIVIDGIHPDWDRLELKIDPQQFGPTFAIGLAIYALLIYLPPILNLKSD